MTTHNLDLQWSQGNQQTSQRVTITSDGENNVAVDVPDASSDLEINLAVDVSQLKLLWLHSDQDLTVKTNSDSAPDDTLTLTGGKPIIWFEGCGHANPLGTDVTKLYATNASGSDATLTVKTLQDVTP